MADNGQLACDRAEGMAGYACDALFELGLRYCTGRGVAPDLVSAHKWFNIAASRGHEEARRYRLDLSRDMSKSDIARAQRLAREWLAANCTDPAVTRQGEPFRPCLA